MEDAARAEFIVRAQLALCTTGFCLLSSEQRWLQANPYLCTLLGYAEPELQQLTWFELTHPDDRTQLKERCANFLAGREESCQFNQRLVHKSGKPVWVEVSLACHRPHGVVDFFVANVVDVTEFKESYSTVAHLNAELEAREEQRMAQLEESQQQLSAAVAAAESANLAKSVFLANMSHELRTPLNAVIGFSRLMAKLPSLSADEIRNLEIINRAGNHLLSLINDVLELSKIEAGRVQLRDEAVSLSELFDDIADMLGERAANAGLRLEIDTGQPGSLPQAISGDSVKLKQVLINLLGNAIKFTPTGAVTLRVRCRQSPDQTQRLEFAVSDTGPGIPPEEQRRIFEPFVQLGTTAKSSGTGLGLSISSQYLRLMGSDLQVESTPGHGTIFRFSLPIKAPHKALPQPRKRHANPLLAEADRGKRVLIAEDTPEARLLLLCLLEPMGFTVAEARDGREALAQAAEFKPDLILMDWRMPLLDGLSATRQIRTGHGPQPRIVILSANAFEENRLAALAAGADGYLRKPLDSEELYDALEHHLDIHLVGDESVTAASVANAVPLTPEYFATLPPELLQALQLAVKELNQAKIFDLLDALGREHQELAMQCRRLTEDFQFQQLWQYLNPETTP